LAHFPRPLLAPVARRQVRAAVRPDHPKIWKPMKINVHSSGYVIEHNGKL
jgi:hypothetical protein